MTSFRFGSLIFSGVALLGLSACGEGWEMVPYDGTPYGDERTAGSGVAYVRALMLPERGPNLESEMMSHTQSEPAVMIEPEFEPEVVAVIEENEMILVEEEEEIKDAEPLFEAEQKGKK